MGKEQVSQMWDRGNLEDTDTTEKFRLFLPHILQISLVSGGKTSNSFWGNQTYPSWKIFLIWTWECLPCRSRAKCPSLLSVPQELLQYTKWERIWLKKEIGYTQKSYRILPALTDMNLATMYGNVRQRKMKF